MNWAAQYVGIPWEAGSQGPDAYDCMAFFRMIQGKYFGIEVPIIIAPDYDNPETLVELFGDHEERGNWLKQPEREHGCGVLIHRPIHVGTWLNVDGGGVLHCVRGVGVIFTHDAAWRLSGFGRREFFRHK